MKLKLLAATIIMVSFTSGVYAKTGTGFYTSIKSGVSDINFEDNTAAFIDGESSPISGEGYVGTETFSYTEALKHKDSDNSEPMVAVALGFDFSNMSPVNARAELEYTYKGKTSFNPGFTSVTETYQDSYSVVEGSNTYTGNNTQSNTYSVDEPGFITNELRIHQLMLNGYYDFKNTSKFTPYLSAGVGVTHLKNKVSFDDVSETDSDNNFTWSVGAGVAYKVISNVSLDIGYRYVDAGDFEFSKTMSDESLTRTFKSTADLSSHDYTVGIRYNF